MKLFSCLLEQVKVVLSEPPCVHDHLTQIGDVLLDSVTHLLDRDHVMAVVLIIHTGCTNSLGALLAEILNAFVLMTLAGDHLHDRLPALVSH